MSHYNGYHLLVIGYVIEGSLNSRIHPSNYVFRSTIVECRLAVRRGRLRREDSRQFPDEPLCVPLFHPKPTSVHFLLTLVYLRPYRSLLFATYSSQDESFIFANSISSSDWCVAEDDPQARVVAVVVAAAALRRRAVGRGVGVFVGHCVGAGVVGAAVGGAAVLVGAGEGGVVGAGTIRGDGRRRRRGQAAPPSARASARASAPASARARAEYRRVLQPLLSSARASD